MSGIFALYKCVGETAIDEKRSECLKHEDSTNQAEVVVRENIGEHYTGDGIENLLRKAVDNVPF